MCQIRLRQSKLGVKNDLAFQIFKFFANSKFAKKYKHINDISWHKSNDYWAGDTIGIETYSSNSIEQVVVKHHLRIQANNFSFVYKRLISGAQTQTVANANEILWSWRPLMTENLCKIRAKSLLLTRKLLHSSSKRSSWSCPFFSLMYATMIWLTITEDQGWVPRSCPISLDCDLSKFDLSQYSTFSLATSNKTRVTYLDRIS